LGIAKKQQSVCVVKTGKIAGKPDATSILDKSSGSLNCFGFPAGPSIKAKSTHTLSPQF